MKEKNHSSSCSKELMYLEMRKEIMQHKSKADPSLNS